jgi:hypothetical protein
VDSDEIVVGKVQRKRSIVILPFLAESVGQPGKPPNLHSHAQVLALDMRRANLVGVRVSDDWHHLRCGNFRRRVAVLVAGAERSSAFRRSSDERVHTQKGGIVEIIIPVARPGPLLW